MKILREFVSYHDMEHLVEKTKEGDVKDVHVRGVFAQAETKNKNGRIYPQSVMERELYKLQQMVVEDKLTGELDHPEKPEVLLQNAAIKITKLRQDGNNILGEAKIMKSTPKGAIAFGLAKEGIKFGTSTRGLGSLTEKEGVNYVSEDYNWLTNDLVADPSAPDAWVDSIMECADYYIDNGYIKENVHATYMNKLSNISKQEGSDLQEKLVKLYDNFLNEI